MSVFSLANFLIWMTVGVFQTLLAVCPPGWLAWQDACYILLPDRMDWWQAKEVCDRPGSSLVVSDSREEHDFLWREIKVRRNKNGTVVDTINVGLWIGCKDTDNHGMLSCFGVNGDPAFKNWVSGEPHRIDNHCVYMSRSGHGQWRDSSCSKSRYAVCEMRVSHRSYCLQADANGCFTPQCLLNHEIKILMATGVIGCGWACWAEPRCHSFNLWQEGDDKKVCQLNNVTSNEADLKYVKNCNFFDL